jgi:hypothetical protein
MTLRGCASFKRRFRVESLPVPVIFLIFWSTWRLPWGEVRLPFSGVLSFPSLSLLGHLEPLERRWELVSSTSRPQNRGQPPYRARVEGEMDVLAGGSKRHSNEWHRCSFCIFLLFFHSACS